MKRLVSISLLLAGALAGTACADDKAVLSKGVAALVALQNADGSFGPPGRGGDPGDR